ncbi:ThuA domain-containing protein [soil metagenome]
MVNLNNNYKKGKRSFYDNYYYTFCISTHKMKVTNLLLRKRFSHILTVTLFAFFFTYFYSLTNLVFAQTKIVFLAEPKDHGVPGRHEYEKDLKVLAWCLENAINLSEIKTKIYVGKAPRDLTELKDASAIVILSSSDRLENETHPLFPPEPTTDRRTYDSETLEYLKEFDEIIRTGVGVAVFHYANWVENWTARRYYMDWIGGLWVQGGSKNLKDQWSMSLKNKNHPVLRGIKPWSYYDEIFVRFLLPNDPNRTDLVIATPAESPVGPQVAGWAYDREDGGRGFVYGGVDYHENILKEEDYRKFLLNGIVWAAGIEVPAEGVVTKIPEEIEGITQD